MFGTWEYVGMALFAVLAIVVAVVMYRLDNAIARDERHDEPKD